MMRALYFQLIPHPLLLAAPLFLVALLLQRTGPGTRWLALATRVAPLGPFTIFLLLAATYYSSYAFIDHVESQVASTAAAAMRGQPIYHTMDGHAAYALGYGPLLYLSVEAAYVVFGASLLAAKSTTLIANLVTLLACGAVLRRANTGIARSLGLLLAGALVPFGALVWLRADPLLLMCASLGWLVAEFAPRGVAQILLGALMGAAANLKLHGGLYVLPALLWRAPRDGWRWTLLTPALGGALALAPVFAAGFGVAYLDTLRVNAGHGLDAARGGVNLEFALFLAVPLGLAWSRTGDSPPLRLATAGLGFAFLAVATIASKPGAGHWHFLPLLPSVVVLAALAGRATPLAPRSWRSAGHAAWWAVAIFLAWTRHDDWIAYLWRDAAKAQIAELHAVLAAHPGQATVLGAGDDAYGPGHQATFVRSELILRGQPYHFDPCAIMDIRKAGLPDSAAIPPGILQAPQPLVLIPHGEQPFALRNYYGGDLFPAEFQAAFRRSYVLRSRGRYFDLWEPLR